MSRVLATNYCEFPVNKKLRNSSQGTYSLLDPYIDLRRTECVRRGGESDQSFAVIVELPVGPSGGRFSSNVTYVRYVAETNPAASK